MKSSLDHLPERKQSELARVVEILHEEFADAMAGSTAEFKKLGRIQHMILFGSYARGTWVDEPHTMKGYRSDYDVLIIVNNAKLTDPKYWYKAKDRLNHDHGIKTPVSPIVHSRREIVGSLRIGQYFFSDIRRDGIVLYELGGDPLPEPKDLIPAEAFRVAKEYFESRYSTAVGLVDTARYSQQQGRRNESAFLLHQAIEQTYSSLLLVLTNYSPPSHNLDRLRRLAEGQDRRLVEAWPRDRQRYTAWFNTVNEAYVKARYSPHYEISEEALTWLLERTAVLQDLVKTACIEHLGKLADAVAKGSR
jgi:predicted nucleotidyltransferase/HEPN domain-containing protein